MSLFTPSEQTLATIRRLGSNLRLARKRRRRTIAEVAAMAGVSVSTIKRLERGDPAIKIAIYLSVAELFQLADTFRLAEPEEDIIGLTLEKQRLPKRVRKQRDKRLDF